ncbi:MAG: choice-of-anchor J domain-containing protein [Thermoplasmata archaeon]|nr:choice-of-anchor J domain-containing protein [Thermoplasmata archaeon]
MKRCPVCGYEAGDADKFCKQCSYVFPKTVHEKLDEIIKEIEKPEKAEEEIEEELDEILESLGESEEEPEPAVKVPESRESVSLGRAPQVTRDTGTVRAGRINGMTNGLTNGTFKPTKIRKEIKRREYRKIVVPLVVGILMIASLMALVSIKKEKIQLDGELSDWEGARKSQFSAGTVPAQIDILNAAIDSDEKWYYFLVEVRGEIFVGDARQNNSGYMDILQIFVDTDRNPETGYYVKGIGAEYVLNIGGCRGAIFTHEVYKFDETRNRFDWEGKVSYGSIDCAQSTHAVELRVQKKVFNTDTIEVVYHMFSYNGMEDFSDYIVSNKEPALVCNVRYVGNEVIDNAAEFLRVELTAPQADVVLKGITLKEVGSSQPVEVEYSINGGARTKVSFGGIKEIDFNNLITRARTEIVFYLNASAHLPESAVGIEIDGREGVRAEGVVSLIESQEAGKARISYVKSAPSKIKIDGAFGDWRDKQLEEDEDDAPAQYNIRKFGAFRNDGNVSFYVSVEDALFLGAEVPFTGPVRIEHNITPPQPVTPPPLIGYDYLRIYISRENITFGYNIYGLLANYKIEVIGLHGKILNTTMYEFNGASIYDERWNKIDSPVSAKDGLQIEVLCGLAGNLTVVFETSNWNHSIDWSRSQTSVSWKSGEIIPMAYTQLVKVTDGVGSSAERFGYSIASLGDVNGNGVVDFAVSAPYADYSGRTDCGAVYVFYGYKGMEFANINPGNANITIYGNNSNDNLGWNITAADIDGNGVSELIIGAPNASNGTLRPGRVYVVPSSALSSPKTIDLSIYPYGIKCINGTGEGDRFGWSLSAGNTNGVSTTDLIVGAPGVGQDVYSTDFEGSTDEGWTHYNTGGSATDQWQRGTPTSPPTPRSGTKCWGTNLAGNYANGYSAALESPQIKLPAGALYLSFWHWRDFQATSAPNDGGLLEIATSDDNFATWTQINLHMPYSPWPHYNGTITSTTNPLYNKEAWYADVQAWYECTVLLGDYAGKTIKVRFHFGSDSTTVARGWYIDDFRVWGPAGRTYVFYDGTMPNFAKNANAILAGAYPNEQFGYSVSGGGDLNNDGKDDLAVGSPNFKNNNIESGRGRVSAFNGGSLAPTQIFLEGFETPEISNQIPGWYENSNNANIATLVTTPTHSGSRAARLQGHLTQIAYIGKEFDMRNATNVQLSWWWRSSGLDAGEDGEVYLFAEDRWFCLIMAVPNTTAYEQVTIDLSKYFYMTSSIVVEFDIWANANNEYVYIDDVVLTATRSKKIIPTSTNSGFGTSVAITPSLNGDAYGDLIVGAPNNNSARGSANVYYHYPNAAGISEPCAITDMWIGYLLDSSEFLAQAFVAPKTGYISAVEVSCVDYGTDSTAAYFSINATSAGLPGSAISSQEAMDFTSWGEWKVINFATPPYVTQGATYWIVGINYDSTNNGYIWLADNSNPYPDAGSSWTSGGAWQTPTADDLCFIVHYAPNATISGANAGDNFGFSVGYLGDLNGNGSKDFAVGAPNAGNTGAIYVFDGNRIQSVMTATGAEFYYFGSTSGSNLGWAVAGVGDVNADAFKDLCTGAPANSSNNGYSVVVSTQVHECQFAFLFMAAVPAIPGSIVFRARQRKRKCQISQV